MRFMHIADVHLGAEPDHGYVWSKDRGRELWESFRHVIEEANEEQVDLLLIAGDLFHREPREKELKEVNYLFSTLKHTVVALIAGNHDYLRPDSPCLTFPWAGNVVCLFSPDCERVRLPEIRTEIYGFSYYRQQITKPVLDDLIPEKNDYFKILLAHGGEPNYLPMDREKLKAAGFDYIALGHIHKPQVFIENLAVYPGSLEPIDCSDYEKHGYILGEMTRKGVKLSFIQAARRQYIRAGIPVTEEDGSYSVREKIARTIKESGEQNTYRLVLDGQRDPSFVPDIREYLKCGRVLDVEDLTVPAFHPDKLRRQYRGQLIGNFIDSFGENPEDPIEQKALNYGLEALLYQDH